MVPFFAAEDKYDLGFVRPKWGQKHCTPKFVAVDSSVFPFSGLQTFHSPVKRLEALKSPRFPLKLVRCRVCNHYHLSQVASRSELFEHYLYRSGTSSTLKAHFDWLAGKARGRNQQGPPTNQTSPAPFPFRQRLKLPFLKTGVPKHSKSTRCKKRAGT